MRRLLCMLVATSLCTGIMAQPDRWQQKVKYKMDIDMNVLSNQYAGKQQLEYWNNSPDTLTRLFYHLYFNAFQPGSMMDERSRRQGTLQNGRNADWDSRVKDRIQQLTPEEIGNYTIHAITINGKKQEYNILETILEVKLDKPILPKSKVTILMDFEAQIPLQIRRSGRDNPTTKVRYSMSQWYPKICEYDYEGWHANPYIGREFYGVWGDFDVNISLDKNYIIAASGILSNPLQVGYGYEEKGQKVSRPAGEKLLWKFTANNVHDFMWAADPEYIHAKRLLKNGTLLRLFYKTTNVQEAAWLKILDDTEKVFPFIEKTFGKYPYKEYAFIHGGDGGMEYPMGTLLNTPGAWLHELMHAWYYGILGNNESLYPWMDEGFTSYADSRVSAFLKESTEFPYTGSYRSYITLTKSGKEEPLSTHADHFNTNYAFSQASYSKGAVFLAQLGYIIGDNNLDNVLLEYYNQWKFKHPTVTDFIRVAEKVTDIKLDWYKQYWVYSTKTIDYKFDSLWQEGNTTKVRIKRAEQLPMPIDLQITLKDGSKEIHYIPLGLMYGSKPAESDIPRIVYPGWNWTHETYVIETKHPLTAIAEIEIDPSQRLADTDRNNNKIKIP